MKIYPAERDLENQIKASRRVKCAMRDFSLDVDLENKFMDYLEGETALKANKAAVKGMEKLAADPHRELLYSSGIMVTSCMNENDDVFLPEETWASRFTTLNTPIDKQHERRKIVGHTFHVAALDADKKEIDITAEEAPDFFHLETSFVIYKSLFPNYAKKLKKLYSEGKAFLSMECLVGGFDYAIAEGDNISVIARNEETAGLTKYLSAYGGPGYIKGKKLGRVLRDITFTGTGIVSVPGNTYSTFTNLVEANFTKELFENKTVVLVGRRETFLIER